MKRRVTVLSPTLSGNALGRAWVFVELLADAFEVELVAAASEQDAIWAPLADRVHGERRWSVRHWPEFRLTARRRASELLRGDVVIAVKPRLHSYGLALAQARQERKPLILDIDDWELGLLSPWKEALRAPVSWFADTSKLHTCWYWLRSSAADAVTVSSTQLESRFGGTWIPHARPASAPAEPAAWATAPTVMFVGTPRPHKGLGDLILAFRALRSPEARLRLIGVEDRAALDAWVQGDPRISLEPPVPLSQLPHVLAQAWLVAIPQRDALASRAQLPAKLMDAMALGKAVLSTEVGDIPRWLAGNAGVVVPPGSLERMTSAMAELLASRPRLEELGQRARARFLELGSLDAVRPRLLALVEALLRGERAPSLPTPL